MGRGTKTFACGDGVLLPGSDQSLLVLDWRAAKIWQAVEAGLTADVICDALASSGNGNIEQIRIDVAALIARWHEERRLDTEPVDNPRISTSSLAAAPEWAGAWRCQLRDTVIDVAVERSQHALVLDRSLTHFPATRDTADARVEVRDVGEGMSITFVNGMEYARGLGVREANRAFVQLAWPEMALCAMAHAGAVAGENGAACIAGASGSGKSTLIARLVRDGLTYLSDDLTPLCMDGRLLPWPMPISIKAGSWPLLTSHHPSLGVAPSFAAKDTQARLLKLETDAWHGGPQPSRIMVFPRYRAGDTPAPAPIPPLEALQHLIEAGILIEEPVSDERVEALIGWIEKTPAYALPFGDLDSAAAHVHRLLERH